MNHLDAPCYFSFSPCSNNFRYQWCLLKIVYKEGKHDNARRVEAGSWCCDLRCKLFDKPGLPGNSAGDIDKPILEQGSKGNGRRTDALSAISAFFWCVKGILLIGKI